MGLMTSPTSAFFEATTPANGAFMMETSRACRARLRPARACSSWAAAASIGELDLLALLLGDGVLLDQPVHALLVAEGVGVAGFGHGHAGLGLLELEADGLGLELGQELALGHAVAFLDVDAGDLAAHLGRDVDLGPGLDACRYR